MLLRLGRSGLVNALGAGQVWTCQSPWGWAGLDLTMPLGPDRPGLINALFGLNRSGLVNALKERFGQA